MRANSKAVLLCLVVPLAASSCATSTQLTTQQKRQLTTQRIEGSYEDIYAAIMTVLQDRNCVIKNTDMDTGLIFAKQEEGSETPAGEVAEKVVQIVGAIFDADIPTSDDVTSLEITCLIGKIDESSSLVRITMQETVSSIETTGLVNSNKDYKMSSAPVYDEERYRRFFFEVAVEVKRREAMNKM